MKRTCGMFGMLLTGGWVCLLTCVEGSDTQRANATTRPAVIKEYEAAWLSRAGDLDVSRVKRLVGDLSAKDTEARRVAYRQLEAETRLRRIWFTVFDPERDPASQAKALREWERYARALEKARDEWIPMLIRAPTWHHGGQRAALAMQIGADAPHPAFVPLLEAIVSNSEETFRDRYRALRGLVLIPHPAMVEFVAEQLECEDPGLIWSVLDTLTSRGSGIVPDRDDPATWKRIKAEFLGWWAEHKKDWKYERLRMMKA